MEFQSSRIKIGDWSFKIRNLSTSKERQHLVLGYLGLLMNVWRLFNSFSVPGCTLEDSKLYSFVFSTTTQWNSYQPSHCTGRESKAQRG